MALPTLAYDWNVAGRVKVVEGTYVPDSVTFNIDVAAGNCPAGGWLTWSSPSSDPSTRRDNVKAVYALLLTAKATGGTVTLFGSNNGCKVEFIHLS
ncbi:hypothetical protein [Chitinimonas koreensis]|uniref:hypothetical protein n=1 Tax=Chitinimonas koreensis TaxID=356302 RepID=UPI0016549222|nr:hypothetical protein [Chitinimonas koreensis]QNM94834.1 hypothetical protein H9L41_12910 [Chitinimonas koreensis]